MKPKAMAVEPGLWRHYKGGRYEVLGMVRHSETEEALVLYKPLGASHIHPLWVRPAAMFTEKVRVNGKSMPRFEKMKGPFRPDAPDRAALMDWLVRGSFDAPRIPWPARIDLVVFDFDGVMTDNSVRVTAMRRDSPAAWRGVSGNASESVVCSRGDGMGIDRLRKAGVRMMVLSKEKHPVVSARCAKLKLDCHQGVDGKLSYLKAHLKKNGFSPKNVIYLGNDVNDLECLKFVGLPVVVSDAHPSVLAAAKLILRHPGGRGAVRELSDRLIAHLDQKRKKAR